MALSGIEKRELEKARALLERPGFLIRLMSRLGEPIDRSLHALPVPVRRQVQQVSHSALEHCMKVATRSLAGRPVSPAHSLRAHRRMVMTTGGFGGFFGLAGLAIELPVSTVLMFRGIADVARSFGEDITQPETALNCMQVFAYGGTSAADDAAETGYFAARAGLAQLTAEAARHLTSKSAVKGAARWSAPVLTRFTHGVAARFGTVVSEKVLAMGVPIIGAVGGATVNAVFMRHFQETAWAHFRIRDLERRHGPEIVRQTWTEPAPAPLSEVILVSDEC